MIKKAQALIKKIFAILNKKQKVQLCWLLVGLVVYALFETVGVAAILPLVEAMVYPDQILQNETIKPILQWIHIDDVKTLTRLLFVGTIVLYLIKNVYFSFFSWIRQKFACKMERDIAEYMLCSYMNRGYSFFLGKNTNTLMQGAHIDVYNLYLVINSLLYVVTKLLITLFIGLFMIITDWKMAISLLVAGILCVVLVVFVFQKKLKKAGELERVYYIKSGQILLQMFQGIKEVMVMHKQKVMIDDYRQNLREGQKQQIKRQLGVDLPSFIIEAICVAVIMIILAIRLVGDSVNAEFVAVLATFAVGAFRIMPALSSVSSSINGITTYIPSVNNVYENIIEARKYNQKRFDVDARDNPVYRGKTFSNAINIDRVCFSYGDDLNEVLKGISFEIKKGDSIGIIGSSGAGKSTLADLLLGITQPKSGNIYMDDIPINEIPILWGNTIGFVPQSIYLFDTTIKENVAFATPKAEIDEKRVRQALEKANMLSFVEDLPLGLETEIGERGVRLSGGQRQRIGIARALYNKPEILVLDEATSALDNETEKSVIEAIEELQGEMTLIVIAHRISTLKKCNRIYEIKDGVAVEKEYSELIE